MFVRVNKEQKRNYIFFSLVLFSSPPFLSLVLVRSLSIADQVRVLSTDRQTGGRTDGTGLDRAGGRTELEFGLKISATETMRTSLPR